MDTHPNDTPPSNVSIGGNGAVVFSANGLSAHRTCAISAHDLSPVSPVWDYPSSEFHFHKRADSAAHADVYAYLSYRTSSSTGPKTAILEKYSTLDALDWSYSFTVPVTTNAGLRCGPRCCTA